MLFGEDFVKAEDKYRREQLRDQNHQTWTFGRVTTLIVVASIVVAACGVAPQDVSSPQVRTNSGLIQDLAPVGTPNLAAIGSHRLYQAPEMFPIVAGGVSGLIQDLAPVGIPRTYVAPEMWPEVQFGSFSLLAPTGSLITDLAPVGIPRTYQALEMWPAVRTLAIAEDTRTSGPR